MQNHARLILIKAATFIRARHQAIACLLVFCTCLFVYLANGQLISSNDSIPNTLLAFNWLENHTLNFDRFRDGHYYMANDLFGANGIPYFFVEAPNGHLTSAYPIGVALVSFPLYFLFFIYLKLSALLQAGDLSAVWLSLNMTALEFNTQREMFEKLAAAILTALATVIFYLLVRLKFCHAVALIATFIYAFATLNWVISSQGLWQHTVSNLALLSIMLCLFKANRAEGNRRRLLLLMGGIFCGLLPGIRPTSLLFSIAIVLYSALTYRRDAIFLLTGTTSVLLNTAWSIYYFGFSLRSLLIGGYSSLFGSNSSHYQLTAAYFKDAFWGLLISPSRGFLIFSPVMLFSIPGIRWVYRNRADDDERLICFLAIACLFLFLHYCLYVPWWGAISYGSRFLTDILPVLGYLLCYFLREQIDAVWQWRKPMAIGILSMFWICLMISTLTQTVGAFSDRYVWDTSPMFSRTRLWDWRDSQIERHTKNLALKINQPIPRPRRYLKQLNGVIEQVKDPTQPISGTIVVSPSYQTWLQADLRNTGQAQWFGYDTGLKRGITLVKAFFYDQQGKAVDVSASNLLYVSGMPQPGNTTAAVGMILFPQQPGTYTMTFRLLAQHIGYFPADGERSPYKLTVTVQQGSRIQ